MMLLYTEFSFIKLCLLFEDESKCDELGVKKEDWEIIKEEYKEANPSQEEETLIEAYKKVLKAGSECSKIIGLIQFLLVSSDDWEEYFKLAKLRFTGDLEKDSSYLKKKLQKEKTKSEVFTAQLEKLKSDLDEARKKNDAKPIKLSDLYENLASLEKAGASIPDYKNFSCGQYNAWNSLTKKINKAQK